MNAKCQNEVKTVKIKAVFDKQKYTEIRTLCLIVLDLITSLVHYEIYMYDIYFQKVSKSFLGKLLIF